MKKTFRKNGAYASVSEKNKEAVVGYEFTEHITLTSSLEIKNIISVLEKAYDAFIDVELTDSIYASSGAHAREAERDIDLLERSATHRHRGEP